MPFKWYSKLDSFSNNFDINNIKVLIITLATSKRRLILLLTFHDNLKYNFLLQKASPGLRYTFKNSLSLS